MLRRGHVYLTLGFLCVCLLVKIHVHFKDLKREIEKHQVQFKMPEVAVTTLDLKEAIKIRAGGGAIVLVCVDSGYLEMAVNLHRTSFEKFKMDNYLFVGIDNQVCTDLQLEGIVCVTHEGFLGQKTTDSNWGTTAFKQKTHFKTRVVLEGLLLGFEVLITDVDVVFFKNPFPYFASSDCDIEISNDISEGNSGFYLARPTTPAKKLHTAAWEIGKAKGDKISNQKALDRTMEKMLKKNEIKVKFLAKDLFPNGVNYFEEAKRKFADDPACSKCVIVHNNWILTKAAKTFRFKETGLWLNDHEQYYSSSTRKYLLFTNPVHILNRGELLNKLEKDALYAALHLGKLLNRTVILPRLHSYKSCKGESCHSLHPLNYHYRISTFDEHVGINNYRENSFLMNPLVPPSVVQSASPLLLIRTPELDRLVKDKQYEIGKSVETSMLTPSNLTLGPSQAEALSYCAPYSGLSVLRFQSLYGVYEMDRKNDVDVEYNKMISGAFENAPYRQL